MKRMLVHRIDDDALLSLIGQWLKVRIKSPEGEYTKPSSGSPQGGVISPILANIYLHCALTWGSSFTGARTSTVSLG